MPLPPRKTLRSLLVAVGLILASCRPASAPTLTSPAATAPAATAQPATQPANMPAASPRHSPVVPTPQPTETVLPAGSSTQAGPATQTPPAIKETQAGHEAEIVGLVEQMEAAVLAGDREGYLANVDLSDPIFALEHSRWAADWSSPDAQDHPTHFDLEIRDLRVEGDEATAEMRVSWEMPAGDGGEQRAEYPVRFHREPGGPWRYAGEAWQDLEFDHFQVSYLPGLEEAAGELGDALTEIYSLVTSSLGYEPSTRMEIKLYPTSEALVANTLLSLPPIHGWNEPGEALKLFADPESSLPEGVAHEFVHFLEFDMAGTSYSRMPWWMSEGLAVYISEPYGPPGRPEERMERVKEWQASGSLVPWEEISDFKTVPEDRWVYVYPQGYAFVRYVTETYGQEKRNTWIQAMSVDMDLPQATQAVLGLSFEELNQGFLGWLENY